jgi:hypothetical protein
MSRTSGGDAGLTSFVGRRQDLAEGRRLLTEAIERAVAIGQTWTTAMCRLLLGRTLLRGTPPTDPAGAVTALRLAVRDFAEEDDVGNVLICLLAGAHALILLGRAEDGARLAAAVRREAARRGLVFEPADPIGSAALNAALAGLGPGPYAAGQDDDELDQAAMIALFGANPDGSRPALGTASRGRGE